MGMALLEGRDFRTSDDDNAPAVAIINESAARAAWPGESPLGHRVEMQGRVWEVIGVVSDVRQFSLDRDAVAEIYVPQTQFPIRYARYVLRSSMDPNPLIPTVRARVWSVDPHLPLAEFSSVEGMVSSTMTEPRFRTVLLGGIALLALALSLVGVFGVMAFAVSQQTREIGIRVAMGARRGDVLAEVVGQGTRLILAGVVVGGIGTLAATRVLQGFLFGIEATDPWVFLVGVGVVTATALLACYLPARRATRVDPVVALRYE